MQNRPSLFLPPSFLPPPPTPGQNTIPFHSISPHPTPRIRVLLLVCTSLRHHDPPHTPCPSPFPRVADCRRPLLLTRIFFFFLLHSLFFSSSSIFDFKYNLSIQLSHRLSLPPSLANRASLLYTLTDSLTPLRQKKCVRPFLLLSLSLFHSFHTPLVCPLFLPHTPPLHLPSSLQLLPTTLGNLILGQNTLSFFLHAVFSRLPFPPPPSRKSVCVNLTQLDTNPLCCILFSPPPSAADAPIVVFFLHPPPLRTLGAFSGGWKEAQF